MRTTVDLPDSLFNRLKVLAAQRRVTLKELFQLALRHELAAGRSTAKKNKRLQFPLLHSRQPATLHLTNKQIDEFLA